MVPKDKLGRDITVGDYIVYSSALGRCAVLKIGKVLAIKPRKDSWDNKPCWSITVVGVYDYGWKDKPEIQKKGTLQFPDRTVVVSGAAIPEKYFELLKDLA
jgi:hypothetical protein